MSGDIRILRAVLVALAIPPLVVGLLATLAPREFYDDFPFFAEWVSLLPPYNQHLVTDVGGLQLAFGLLFAYAAVRPHPALVTPIAVAWGVSQVLHVAFHVTHLDGFSTLDAIAQTVSLVSLVGLAALAVVLSRRGAVPVGAA
jgi:hypothetical protein